MLISLVEMKTGEMGRVVELKGGRGFSDRISSMGLRVGKDIRKIDAGIFRGPQTVLIDGFQIALGYGMALKILIEVNRE